MQVVSVNTQHFGCFSVVTLGKCQRVQDYVPLCVIRTLDLKAAAAK